MVVTDEKAERAGNKDERENHPLVDLVMDRFEKANSWRSSGCRIMGESPMEWIERMDRAYHKQHEASELEQFPWMRSYFGLIQLKVNATHAWGKNQFLNQRFTPFTLEPTPLADLPKHLDDQAQGRFRSLLLRRLQESGATPDMLIDPALGTLRPEVVPQLEELMRVEKDAARQISHDIAARACNRHARVIKDQLIEGQWHEAFDKTLFDQCLYPYGAMAVERGEIVKWNWQGNRIKRQWETGWRFRHIPVRQVYHAPDARHAQDGSFFIEEITRSKSDLYQLKHSDGAFTDAIDELIAATDSDGYRGDWMHSLTGQGNDTETVFGRDSDVTTLRMQGEVCGSDLADTGLSVNDEDLISITVEVCDGRLLYFDARPFIEGQRSYFSASYVRNSGDAAGISIGMMLYDRQLRINRLEFYGAANERMAHGPVIEQLQRAFAEGETFSFAPWTQVYRSAVAERGDQAIRFHQAQPLWGAIQNQLMAQLVLADHESGIPAFASQGTTAGPQLPTLGQTIVHHQAAAKGIQSWLENNDDQIIAPTIQCMYHDNLIYLKDRSIEADARVHAQGALGAMTRELQGARIAQALPQIIQGAQIGAETGSPLVPTQVARVAMNTFLSELGLPVEQIADNPDTDYTANPMQSAAPGLAIPSGDGRSRVGGL